MITYKETNILILLILTKTVNTRIFTLHAAMRMKNSTNFQKKNKKSKKNNPIKINNLRWRKKKNRPNIAILLISQMEIHVIIAARNMKTRLKAKIM